VAFSADGRTLISSGRDNALRFWSVADGTLVRAVTDNSPAGPLAVSPDRSVVAVPGGVGGIGFYSTVDGRLLRATPETNGPVEAVSISGDGSLLAAGEDVLGGNVQVFATADATLVRTLPGDPGGFVQGVAFGPDGSTLASGSGFTRRIQLWDPATGTLRASFDQETGWGPFSSLPLAYSPDGTKLGYGRGDATVVVAHF